MLLNDSWNSHNAKLFRTGKFIDLLLPFLSPEYNKEDTLNSLKKYLIATQKNETLSNDDESICTLGAAALCLFISSEWGDSSSEYKNDILKLVECLCDADEALNELLLDGENLEHIKYPQLLHLAVCILQHAYLTLSQSYWVKIWYLRALFIQQLFLDELSQELFKKLEEIVKELESFVPEGVDSEILWLELARMYLHYGYIEKSSKLIEKASKQASLKFDFTGMLGKRTRYQEKDIAQLMVKVEVPNNVEETITEMKPRIVELNDDVRLEKIKLADNEIEDETLLLPKHNAILLGSLMLRMKSLPSGDEMSLEEHRSLVNYIIQRNSYWSLELSSLLVRCHIERTGRRTVERAMLQVQSVLEDMKADKPSIINRLNGFFISYLPTVREVETTLADFYISLGAIKSALDIALRLKKFEMAIICFNALQRRHEAKELIEQELAKKETPKLWCLLGDATDDVDCYKKAWDLSNHKSSRAQRHWANFLYSRKKYKESIEHFQKSLELNALQSNLWYRLGFAALHEEEWEISAQAYRRYCILDNDCFEAWNNLARCYCELNQKRRAWRALQEALKIDHNNWRVWDNYMIVSADLKELHEVVQSYNAVLDIVPNHLDLMVLRSLVHNFNSLQNEEQRDILQKKILLLLGRLTCQISNEAELWVIYAEAHCKNLNLESYKKQRDLLFKAHRSAVGKPGWERTWSTCQNVIAILERLLTVTLQANSSENLTAIKMAARGSTTIIERSYPDNDSCSVIKEKLVEIENMAY